MIGYMILAHEDTPQLRQLLEVLASDPRSKIYLHIDVRTAHPAGYETSGLAGSVTRVPPVRVRWAGYSVVTAMLRLLRAALADPDNERFVLLSGSCFPIKPMAAINDAIQRGANTVALWKIVSGPGSTATRKEADAVGKAHYMDIGWLNPSRGKLQRLIQRGYNRINAALPYRFRDHESVAKGSQWFMVDRATATAFVEDGTALAPRFRHSFAPDEIVFPTIFLRRLERVGIAPRFVDQTSSRQALHYLIFRPAPTGRSIWRRASATVDRRLLTLDDLDDVLASDALFARKCTPELCAAIYARVFDRGMISS